MTEGVLPFYAYDEGASAASNLVRAWGWLQEHEEFQCKELDDVIKRAQADYPSPSEEVVRDELYLQFLVIAVAAWANDERRDGRQRSYERALSVLRKWRRHPPLTHEVAMREWKEIKVRKYP